MLNARSGREMEPITQPGSKPAPGADHAQRATVNDTQNKPPAKTGVDAKLKLVVEIAVTVTEPEVELGAVTELKLEPERNAEKSVTQSVPETGPKRKTRLLTENQTQTEAKDEGSETAVPDTNAYLDPNQSAGKIQNQSVTEPDAEAIESAVLQLERIVRGNIARQQVSTWEVC